MASSSSTQYVTVLEDIPYPSNLSAASFISVKLSSRDTYVTWKTQMLCLFESHDMVGFIDGTFSYHKLPRMSLFKLWRRSDAVVKGWILGSLSKETLMYVVKRLTNNLPQRPTNNVHQKGDDEYFTAADLWNELEKIYGQRPVLSEVSPYKEIYGPISVEVQQFLQAAILAGDWGQVVRILENEEVTVIDQITNNGDTALHVAVSTNKKQQLLWDLLERMPAHLNLLEVRNSEGSTLLHVAAIVGNIDAAEILMEKNPYMLLAKDNKEKTPLSIALFNMDDNMSELFLYRMKYDIDKNAQFSDGRGVELLVILISSKKFRLAHELLDRYGELYGDAVLTAMAQNFPNELNILERSLGTRVLGSRVKNVMESVENDMVERCVPLCGSWVETVFHLFFVGIYGIIMFFPLVLKMLVWPFIKKRVQIHNDAKELLLKVCISLHDPERYYKNPIVEATRLNANEVVEGMVKTYPAAIQSANEDGHNIIQIAVINRSEKVYNLFYQMDEHKNVYRTIVDSDENNLLHLAGKLAPTEKLDLISGEFLQIQRELQWFKEVEGFVSPLNVKQKNIFNETPQMVFTREHKDLLNEGEKWLKATAESYTITAALITTIVFAAAITVPGGSNQDTGIPVFTNHTAFTVFAISDAISLFAAVTSLLMFLSILTARFAEQDFLLKLPTKLIIGLFTLFVSTTAMLVASGATLYLVFGQSNSKILITIAVFTCLPIVTFVTLQSRIIIDLMSATYGRSIFGKKSDRPFY